MSLQRPPDLRWALVLIIGTLVILWLAFGPSAHGQTSLNEALETSEEMLNLLLQRLAERQEQVTQLQTDLRETQNSLDALLTHYDELEKNWKDYRTETDAIIARLDCQRKGWTWATVGSSIALVVTILIACLH